MVKTKRKSFQTKMLEDGGYPMKGKKLQLKQDSPHCTLPLFCLIKTDRKNILFFIYGHTLFEKGDESISLLIMNKHKTHTSLMRFKDMPHPYKPKKWLYIFIF